MAHLKRFDHSCFALPISIALIALCASPANAQDGTAAVNNSWPLIVLVIGIFTVLGLIIGLKVNAFLALITAALVVSLLSGGPPGASMGAVASAFGASAGGIGVLIAAAAIIGKCMLDSGAADRIVRACLKIFGPKQSATALMGSGFVLAVPVFFDTVFYLLVPLARSLHKKTGTHYLKYLMAISTGGAITHTLVPPTPGPLLMGANLGVDVGMMMMIGALVAVPSAIIGLLFSGLVDRLMPVPMRSISGKEQELEPLNEDQLPPLWLAIAPVLLPVLMISAGTIADTFADREDRALLTSADIVDLNAFVSQLRTDAAIEGENPARQIERSKKLTADGKALIFGTTEISPDQTDLVLSELNDVLLDRDLHTYKSFLGVFVSDAGRGLLGQNRTRMKNSELRRMNRILLESSYPDHVKEHDWNTKSRVIANAMGLPSNPSFALLISSAIAMVMLVRVRKCTLRQLGENVEEALLSGGMIILITAAGGAFGAMLSQAGVGGAVEALFAGSGGVGGVKLLLLSFLVGAVLKVAQGSGTVAMIVGSGIIGSIAVGQEIGYHPVYLATAVGSGSLVGSWMNDSGFWVFTKMGGLTEAEGLKSWTTLLIVLGVSGLGTTLLMSYLLPLV